MFSFDFLHYSLYFVGFYVLLLFDIVINIQYNDLAAVTASDETVVSYLQNAFFSAILLVLELTAFELGILSGMRYKPRDSYLRVPFT